ncbi:methyltransferase [Candidatus Endobugula sertula]|uniref:Methyltransferase n=1 Tax=Candidatus Endobugula sertula TaxID=62101 RepID=A0A1D2QNF0_9GAMM|nr:methyltransferase [Candidatus Endobugula sertula]
MSWAQFTVSGDGTHHLYNGVPVYEERFDEILAFHQPGLAPVRRGSKAWHIRVDGQAAYSCRFMRTFGFYEGRAAIIESTEEDSWCHIDTAGRSVYRQRYTWCGNFQGQRCTIRDAEGMYYHIDYDGQAVYSEHWRYAGDYRDGIAVVQGSDGRSTHIDDHGQLLHGQWFLNLDVFHKGLARACDEAGWAHINVDGAFIYKRRFAMVEPFYNGQAHVETFAGALEIINEKGESILQLRPPLHSEFSALSTDLVGFWRTQTIATAVSLGIFEVLAGSAEEVAKQCGLNLRGAQYILRALDEMKLVTCHEERWFPTSKGAFLKVGHPLTLADAALEFAGSLSRMWEQLPNALSANSHWTAADIFHTIAQDDVRKKTHHRMLQSYARHDYVSVPQAFELLGNERVIDAGGGLGVLAQLVIATYPNVQVTVFDRPEVIEQGRKTLHQSPKLYWHAGDLFSPWKLESDVVILARILHDWNDEAALRILNNARSVLPTGGRLLVVEMPLSENHSSGALLNLHLLMVTGGRERTVNEYQQLFKKALFSLINVQRLTNVSSVLTAVAM